MPTITSGSKSDWYCQQILGLLMGTSLSGITAYIGLFTTNPTDSSPGTEVTAADYHRQTIMFSLSGTTEISNNGLIDFGIPITDWGTIEGWGIFDSATGGNYILFGPQVPSKHCDVGVPVQYDIGAITYSED